MRKLPDWIPQVPRPWNPAHRETWERMTPNERRVSFLVDCGVCLIVIAVLYGVST